LQYELYLGASGITDMNQADAQFVSRLLELQRLGNPDGKLIALAFDRFFGVDGVEDAEHTNFYTPNDYVLELAREHDAILAAGSIHPYRADAVDRLYELADQGIVAIKWLPAAMGIDPASPRCDAFYAALEQTGVPLLTHAGTEMAVDAAELQSLGNPLRLRRPLDTGVKVIVAHCGSLGDNEDTDDPAHGRVENVDLFLRLMREGGYGDNLLGDISAMTFVNRAGRPLRAILEATDIHDRLLYGSDYPVLAVEPVLSTRWLQLKGFLTAEDRVACNVVLDANPLLGDLLVKRCVRGPDGERFADSVFDTARWFGAA
jgi:mannonate dehydratase